MDPAADAERFARAFTPCGVADVGHARFLWQHQALSQLNSQAHAAAAANAEDHVLAALLTHGKLPALLEELLALEAWREQLFPRLLAHLASPAASGPGASLRAYFCLHHEEVLVNLLEVFLYHDYAAEALGEGLVDLIDYCVRRVTHLVSLSHARAAGAGAAAAAASDNAFAVLPSDVWVEAAAPAPGEGSGGAAAAAAAAEAASPAHQLRRWRGSTVFRLGVTAVALLRYLSDHASKLPLAATARLLDTHDVPTLCVPLLENPPWVRRAAQAQAAAQARGSGAAWLKYDKHAWVPCAAGDLLKLTACEGQPWLTLHALLLEPALRARYALTAHRRGTLLRVRKFMNEVLLDQLPPLADLQRLLDEITIAPPAEVAPEGGRLLMEAVAEVQEGVLARALTAPSDWRSASASASAASTSASSSSSSSSSSSLLGEGAAGAGAAGGGGSGMGMLRLAPAAASAAAVWTWEEAAEYAAVGAKGAFRARRRRPAGAPRAQRFAGSALHTSLGAWPDSEEDEDLGALGDGFGAAGAEGEEEGALEDPKCSKCGALATKRCSRCKNEWYCSRECQVGSWEGHKTVCDIVAADAQ